MKTRVYLLAGLLAVSISAPVVPAQTDGNDPAAAHARAAALQIIDMDLNYMEGLADRAPDGAARTEARARVDALKQRRRELELGGNPSQFEIFRTDVRQAYDQLSVQSRQTSAARQASAPGLVLLDPEDTKVRPRSNGRPVNRETLAKRAFVMIDNFSPAANDAIDVRVALEVLDLQIEYLAGKPPADESASSRERASGRMERLKELRTQLGSEFNPERWSEAVALVKEGWAALAP